MAGKYEKWMKKEGLLMIQGWVRDGLTDEQIASNMGIHRDTLLKWRKRFPNLEEIMRKSKAVVDQQVENALFKRALGYTWEEETRERTSGGEMVLV